MKQFSMKFAAMMAAVLLATLSYAATPDFNGTVLDEKGEPMPFVNVVLLSMPDSAFVQGAMTDDQGNFHITTIKNDGVLRVSSVGYETLFISTQAFDGSPIKMVEASQMLGELVVKSTLPKTRVKGDAMRTTVEGTILEKAGTVSDALARLPMVEAERDGAVKVLGRGDAEVYINGRRVQDMSELSRLRSDQIQHVDVVQNPGARYAATTKAVVRIQLKKAQGEGFSFRDYASFSYQYTHTITNDLNVNYRTGGFDITASFWAGRFGHEGYQSNDLTYFVGPDRFVSHTSQKSGNVWKGWSPQLQVNYMLNENHSFGAFYKYDRHPSGKLDSHFITDNYENGAFTEHSESDIWQNDHFRKHIFNMYYNGKVGQLGIDFNVDGLFDDTKTPGSTTEHTALPDNADAHVTRTIDSNTNSGNDFWATKLIFSYPVWQGNLSVGGEYSNNHRTDAYSFTASDAVPVKATDTKIDESSTAAFAEFGRAFGKVYAQLGLRFEHLKTDYYNFGQREDEVCRDYGDWFPSAVVSVPVGKVQMSLSYRRDIQRPGYSNLTSSTYYFNRYTYQSGNPYLKPTYTHSLVLNAAYKWMNMTVNYGRIKDAFTMSTEPFPGSEDPLISLVRPINTKDEYDQLSIIPSLRPVFGCWHPTWSLYAVFQNSKSLTADGSILTLNHPFVSITWNNDIELPHQFRLNALVQWVSKGDYNNFRLTRTRFFSSLGVQRDFDLGNLGSLNIDVRCADLFNTNKTNATIFGIRELTSHNPARRTFMVDFTWKFNEARSKYRGTGAGDKQKSRM